MGMLSIFIEESCREVLITFRSHAAHAAGNAPYPSTAASFVIVSPLFRHYAYLHVAANLVDEAKTMEARCMRHKNGGEVALEWTRVRIREGHSLYRVENINVPLPLDFLLFSCHGSE